MFDDLYYFFLNFFEQNGIILLIGFITLFIGYIQLKREGNSKKEQEGYTGTILIIIGGALLIYGGIFTLIYIGFFIGLSFFIGFFLHAITKKE